MDKLFAGNRLLTAEGDRLLSDFRYGLIQVMSSDEVSDMSDNELQTLQSSLNKLVGDAISNRMARNMQFANELNAMTDEQFYVHLKDKYGDNWALNSLEKEERARLPLSDLQKLSNTQKYISQAIRQHMISNGVK